MNNTPVGMIFDLDGVLLSTDHFHYRAWKTLADRLNIPFDEKKNDLLRGVSRMDSLRIILGEYVHQYTEEQLEALCTEKNDQYRTFLTTLTPDSLYPGVRQTLFTLRAMGLRLAVGSSSRNAAAILERVQLTDAFDAIIDGNCIARSKPDPEVFLKAADALGLTPAECAVIEDAQAGIDAAKAGGFLAIAFGEHPQDLNGADECAHDMTELMQLIKQ